MKEIYGCVNGLQKYCLHKHLCKYILMKNNPTRDTPLLPVFKFQRVRGRITRILCLDLSKTSQVLSIFPFSKDEPWATCSEVFLGTSLTTQRWLQWVNWKLPERQLSCWQHSTRSHIFLSYNVLIFINYYKYYIVVPLKHGNHCISSIKITESDPWHKEVA